MISAQAFYREILIKQDRTKCQNVGQIIVKTDVFIAFIPWFVLIIMGKGDRGCHRGKGGIFSTCQGYNKVTFDSLVAWGWGSGRGTKKFISTGGSFYAQTT